MYSGNARVEILECEDRKERGLKMRIVWDLDGTLFKDTGKDYEKCPEFTPLMKLCEELSSHSQITSLCVTGRTSIPEECKYFFDASWCRDWEPEDWNTYYPRYFQWKVDTILKLQPDLVFEDDQQIVCYLTKKGVSVIWTPMYAYMGI